MTARDEPPEFDGETEVDRILRDLHGGFEPAAEPVLAPIVRAALESAGWRYTVQDDGGIVCDMAGEHTVYSLLFRVDEALDLVCCFSRVGFRVPDDKRVAVAEALTRANYGLRIGNFEMDLADGEVRYKASVDVEDGALSETMVQNLVRASLSSFDRYYPALMRVVWAGAAPADAIAEVEG
jgi:hypothetical protein